MSTHTQQAQQDAASTLHAVGSAVKPEKAGLGEKVAIAGTIYKLARRYPVPALIVGGIALAIYMGRRNARVPRH